MPILRPMSKEKKKEKSAFDRFEEIIVHRYHGVDRNVGGGSISIEHPIYRRVKESLASFQRDTV